MDSDSKLLKANNGRSSQNGRNIIHTRRLHQPLNLRPPSHALRHKLNRRTVPPILRIINRLLRALIVQIRPIQIHQRLIRLLARDPRPARKPGLLEERHAILANDNIRHRLGGVRPHRDGGGGHEVVAAEGLADGEAKRRDLTAGVGRVGAHVRRLRVEDVAVAARLEGLVPQHGVGVVGRHAVRGHGQLVDLDGPAVDVGGGGVPGAGDFGAQLVVEGGGGGGGGGGEGGEEAEAEDCSDGETHFSVVKRMN